MIANITVRELMQNHMFRVPDIPDHLPVRTYVRLVRLHGVRVN